MAARSVRFHPEAIAEARAAYEWYGERNPSAANAFVSELDDAIRQIPEPTRELAAAHARNEEVSLPTFSLRSDLPDH